MFYVIVQTGCMIIIAVAAVKYLMPDIRKVCQMIADSGESKEKKKRLKTCVSRFFYLSSR